MTDVDEGCDRCQDHVQWTDLSVFHTWRPCSQCGRVLRSYESGANGHGLKVVKGDHIHIPELTIAANPLVSGMRMTRDGVTSFASSLFRPQFGKSENIADVEVLFKEIENTIDSALQQDGIFKGMKLDDEAGGEAIDDIVKEHSVENPDIAFLFSSGFYHQASDAIRENDAAKAAWAASSAERLRSFAIFQKHFLDVVLMGNSAARLVWLFRAWASNRTNGMEAYWQTLFTDHVYVFSQLFSANLTLLEESAYLGGQKIDRSGARIADFLLAGGSGKQSIIVEIKTPLTRLVNRARYRSGSHAPSTELSGGITQLNDYLERLRESISGALRDHISIGSTFNPKRILIIGDYSQLDTVEKVSSFESFRQSINGVEVITFDEFFEKVRSILDVFGLSWKDKEPH